MRGVVEFEKHVRNFKVFIWRKDVSSYTIQYVNFNGLRANRYEYEHVFICTQGP